MRISDWSSDVCSSDLLVEGASRRTRAGGSRRVVVKLSRSSPRTDVGSGHSNAAVSAVSPTKCRDRRNSSSSTRDASKARTVPAFTAGKSRRSEEHTSELQSLMRTSYAVFCLKKKNKTKHQI